MHNDSFLVDSFGRRIDYLRISLTDRCNFKCLYCAPLRGLPLVPQNGILSKDEIVRFVRIMSGLGVEHVRLTGGEPLLREDLLEIVRYLKKIVAVRDLSMTTNGSRLGPFVKPLREAGLDRLNISLDCLNFERFKKVTLSNCYSEVIQSIRLSLQEGFPVKLNMVVLKGINDHEITGLTGLASNYPLEVRFLEFMPLCGSGWREELFFPMAQIRKRVADNFELEEEMPRGQNVAQVFGIKGGKGRVGFIASLTEPFCDACSRLRLTCDGKIRLCLFSKDEYSVKELLRSNASDWELIEAIRDAVKMKPRGNPYFYGKPYRQEEALASGLSGTPFIRSIGG